MKVIDYTKVNTRPKTIFIEIIDATIQLLLLVAVLTIGYGFLYMMG